MPKRKKTIEEKDVPSKSKIINAPSTSSFEIQPSGDRICKDFFDKDCVALSKALLGTRLVRRLNDSKTCMCGIIVETEAYLGGDDKASHSYNGKKTEKTEAMFMEPGTIYVYNIYGVYTCINFSSQGEGAAVLIRAIDADSGLEEMRKNRSKKRKPGSKALKDKELGNGPSKLTEAMNISKNEFNKQHLNVCDDMWLEEGITVSEEEIVISTRIGIESSGEQWSKAPLRFYLLWNKSVSKRDKDAESKLKQK